MRVFVTGASGHIGSAVVPELLAAGHTVVGLARSDASAATLTAWGASVRRGDLDDLDGLREAARDADGVIHLAFKHDLMQSGRMNDAVAADLAAMKAFGDALQGTGKPIVGVSGSLSLAGLGRTGTEADVVVAPGTRSDVEDTLIGLADQGVRSSVIRIPPLVHSVLDRHGFGPSLIAMARKTGVAGYPGDGSNRWPAAHTLDVARLYRIALEQAPAGTRWHAIGDPGVPMRDIAQSIGDHLGLPTVSIPDEQRSAQFGFLAMFIGLDNPMSCTETMHASGWEPTHPGLLVDLDAGHYFDAA